VCLRRRKFVVTTNSAHPHRVYPHVAADIKPTAVNQLCVADITYIRLEAEFVYLAVVLDSLSRRVVGYALDRTLEASLTVTALRQALEERQPAPGLVHHSDRGTQYACSDYTDLLKEHGITISMSRKGNPYDNAACESFMKTLKYEEVYRQEYRSLAEARASIERFLEEVYNTKRLHPALGIGLRRSSRKTGRLLMRKRSFLMRFFRHDGIYRSDVIVRTQGWGRGTASRWSVPGPSRRT
jgi:putative transposase